MTSKKTNKHFEEEKKILELRDKFDEKHHKRRMKELEFARESNKIFHNLELERQRIKSAEIRKGIELKELSKMRSNKHGY